MDALHSTKSTSEEVVIGVGIATTAPSTAEEKLKLAVVGLFFFRVVSAPFHCNLLANLNNLPNKVTLFP